jgi:hypothetical protein
MGNSGEGDDERGVDEPDTPAISLIGTQPQS